MENDKVNFLCLLMIIFYSDVPALYMYLIIVFWFVSDLRQVGVFLRVVHQKKLTATI